MSNTAPKYTAEIGEAAVSAAAAFNRNDIKSIAAWQLAYERARACGCQLVIPQNGDIPQATIKDPEGEVIKVIKKNEADDVDHERKPQPQTQTQKSATQQSQKPSAHADKK